MKQEKEQWRDVVGYEGRYQVSNLGRVMTLGTGTTHKQKRLLNFTTSHGRYYIVTLTKDGISKSYSVHRLVALSFIPNNEPSKDQIDHIDGDSFNNAADNLRWCTAKENNLNPITRVRKSKSKMGESNPNHKSRLTPERYEKLMRAVRAHSDKSCRSVLQIYNGEIIKRFESIKQAGKETEITPSNISLACRGLRQTAGGFIWKFVDGELVTKPDIPL